MDNKVFNAAMNILLEDGAIVRNGNKLRLSRDEMLISRTCRIIRQGGLLYLKRTNGDYLHQHTNIAAGWDAAIWGYRLAALEISDLNLAFRLAPYFKAKVVSYYPNGKKR